MGHAGTLDPLAEGVLIILVGKATKRQVDFMKMKKEYLVEAIFGVTTPTWDLEFKPVPYKTEGLKDRLENLTEDLVKEKLRGFEGEIIQIVPSYSAVKVKGKRLYQMARKGKIDDRDLPRRKAMVYSIELLDFEKGEFPKVKIKMVVGRGTYVRSIVYQLGEELGVGAVVSKLVRTKIGKHRIKQDLQ